MATIVSTTLPDLTLEQSSILHLEAGDPAAKITQVVIHFSQDAPEDTVILPSYSPLFTYQHVPG